MVEIVYLTTKNKKPLPTHTEVIANIPSTVLCKQIYSVSKEKLGDYVRSCTDAEMERINKCLAISIGLDGLTETAQNISGDHEPEKTEAPEPEKAPQDVETYEKLLKNGSRKGRVQRTVLQSAGKGRREMITRKKCRTCCYRSRHSDTGGGNCDYMLITGKRRGCPPDKCTKYQKGPRKRWRQDMGWEECWHPAEKEGK